MSAVPVVVALGSNLGDRHGHVAWAVTALTRLLEDVRLSPVVESLPEDVPDVQPSYLNAVVVGTASGGPEALLEALLALERERGRTRTTVRGARTLDLDLILYGDEVRRSPELTLPHPRFRERRFVLEPLVAVAPDLRDPITGRTAAELLAALDAG